MSRTPSLHRIAACTIAALAAAVLAAPAEAGSHYKSVTRIQNEGQDPMTIASEAWIEGDDAKIVFTESANPLAPAAAVARN